MLSECQAITLLQAFQYAEKRTNALLDLSRESGNNHLSQSSPNLKYSPHLNIGVGAHISFGNDVEYDLSLEYLFFAKEKFILGFGLSSEIFFANKSNFGTVSSKFLILSVALESTIGSANKYSANMNLGFGINEQQKKEDVNDDLLSSGPYLKIGLARKFITKLDAAISLEGGLTYQFANVNGKNSNLEPVNAAHHFIKPHLVLLFSFY